MSNELPPNVMMEWTKLDGDLNAKQGDCGEQHTVIEIAPQNES